MDHIYYEDTEVMPDRGFLIRFVTMKYNTPMHWHKEMEILYILNGSARVRMEGRTYELKPLDLIVIDTAVIHDVVYSLPQTMGICIHISKTCMKRYLPNMELLRIICSPGSAEKRIPYMKLCQYLKELTVLYFRQKQSYPFASSALVLQIMSVLVDDFCEPGSNEVTVSGAENLTRMEQTFRYVEKNYKGQITLQEAADVLGLSREYFCRFFKQNTGMTFLQFVNQVRLGHIYQDLLHTEKSIEEAAESNGMYNTKLFYRLFKERYGCTPKALKKLSTDNPLFS